MSQMTAVAGEPLPAVAVISLRHLAVDQYDARPLLTGCCVQVTPVYHFTGWTKFHGPDGPPPLTPDQRAGGPADQEQGRGRRTARAAP
ncbi:hypothetical protein, partial [Kitasatospora herbaricolor]|uniref:hypothetical protein n=1 Tax=Kitasatospora herbaricolor TaxID=68217 RepID=UPI0036DBC541